MSETSKNARAGEVCGFRPTDGINIDMPCELGYHCPVCQYPQTTDGNYDERLEWSEYDTFIWCSVCNKDYPSCLCERENIDTATKLYIDAIEYHKAAERERVLKEVREIIQHYGDKPHSESSARGELAFEICAALSAIFPDVTP